MRLALDVFGRPEFCRGKLRPRAGGGVLFATPPGAGAAPDARYFGAPKISPPKITIASDHVAELQHSFPPSILSTDTVILSPFAACYMAIKMNVARLGLIP
jgi:hypothetical protein